jgi:hypothetical protein
MIWDQSSKYEPIGRGLKNRTEGHKSDGEYRGLEEAGYPLDACTRLPYFTPIEFRLGQAIRSQLRLSFNSLDWVYPSPTLFRTRNFEAMNHWKSVTGKQKRSFEQ